MLRMCWIRKNVNKKVLSAFSSYLSREFQRRDPLYEPLEWFRIQQIDVDGLSHSDVFEVVGRVEDVEDFIQFGLVGFDLEEFGEL